MSGSAKAKAQAPATDKKSAKSSQHATETEDRSLKRDRHENVSTSVYTLIKKEAKASNNGEDVSVTREFKRGAVDIVVMLVERWAAQASDDTRYTRHFKVGEREVLSAIRDDAQSGDGELANHLQAAITASLTQMTTTMADAKALKEATAAAASKNKAAASAAKKTIIRMAQKTGVIISVNRVLGIARSVGAGARGKALMRKKTKKAADVAGAAPAKEKKGGKSHTGILVRAGVALAAAAQYVLGELVDGSVTSMKKRGAKQLDAVDLFTASTNEKDDPQLMHLIHGENGGELLWLEMGPALPYMVQYGMSMGSGLPDALPQKGDRAANAAANKEAKEAKKKIKEEAKAKKAAAVAADDDAMEQDETPSTVADVPAVAPSKKAKKVSAGKLKKAIVAAPAIAQTQDA